VLEQDPIIVNEMIEYKAARAAFAKWTETKGDKKGMTPQELDLIHDMIVFNNDRVEQKSGG